MHAHHLRHWLLGGGTDVDNLVLLCDVDHGLVHELDLVMTRRNGRLVVVAPDGRRVWGAADAAFAAGLDGITDRGDAQRVAFSGVQPIDELAGRRPVAPSSGGVAGLHGRAAGEGSTGDRLTAVLFPDGPPRLLDAMHVNGERMDLAYAVGVLMGNRDLRRRLEAEARGDVPVAA
ncbi:HNH endonuclease signature motif containing protein [Blastococcus montanus]|uniref:HNH endonuclease signature motif containing protein n=1 Tax=Blastococcus montanus TaxID=3144973 RepID=UPI00387E40A5